MDLASAEIDTNHENLEEVGVTETVVFLTGLTLIFGIAFYCVAKAPEENLLAFVEHHKNDLINLSLA